MSRHQVTLDAQHEAMLDALATLAGLPVPETLRLLLRRELHRQAERPEVQRVMAERADARAQAELDREHRRLVEQRRHLRPVQ